MKRLFALISLVVLGLGLAGCQFFQPKPAANEVNGTSESSTATLNVGEGSTATSQATLEIKEPASATSEATLEIKEPATATSEATLEIN
ncbi:hypothetical protein KJ835_03565 [Patescibacteria group bacterium]|nr:hypothetical protein [Patescibacteria group bacterium]